MESTFQLVARSFPELAFMVAEYGPEARRAAEIMRDLPDRRGLGTFYWEPTESGSWGPSLFTRQDATYRALDPSFRVFDSIRADFGISSAAIGPSARE